MTSVSTPWLAALLAVNCAHAAVASPAPGDTDLRCPATIAQAPVASDLPQGWIVHGLSGELRLQGAAFYDGDPVGLGAIEPESTHRNGQVETSVWRFDPGESARVWIGCRYRDASAVVARPLPAGLQQCTTTLRLTTLGDPGGPVSVRCR